MIFKISSSVTFRFCFLVWVLFSLIFCDRFVAFDGFLTSRSAADAVACAGSDTAGNRRTTRTLNYDGTSWTTNVATLGQGRESPMSAGTSSAGLICNGFDNASPPFLDGTTEEFTGQVIATKTVDVS